MPIINIREAKILKNILKILILLAGIKVNEYYKIKALYTHYKLDKVIKIIK